MTNADTGARPGVPPVVPKVEMHHDVRDLLDEVFPPVEEGIRYQQMRALEKGDRLKNLWKRIVEQTLWTLAKNDLIRSPEDEAVIKTAREWAASWGDLGPEHEAERVDRELYDAVRALPSATLPE